MNNKKKLFNKNNKKYQNLFQKNGLNNKFKNINKIIILLLNHLHKFLLEKLLKPYYLKQINNKKINKKQINKILSNKKNKLNNK